MLANFQPKNELEKHSNQEQKGNGLTITVYKKSLGTVLLKKTTFKYNLLQVLIRIVCCTVVDREMRECVALREMGSPWVGRRRGGPGPPSGEQDKQLVCNSGGDKTSMGESGGLPDRLDATSRTHHAQSM
jgi:hypothetical protein